MVRDIAVFRDVPADLDEEVLASPTWDALLREYGPTIFDDRSDRTLPQPRTPDLRESRIGSFSQHLNDSWSPPDLGFIQDAYTESDLDKGTLEILADVMGDQISNFYAIYGEESSSSIQNPFIDDEAEESDFNRSGGRIGTTFKKTTTCHHTEF